MIFQMTSRVETSDKWDAIIVSTCHNGMNYQWDHPVFETAWHWEGSEEYVQASKCFDAETAAREHAEVVDKMTEVMQREQRPFRQRIRDAAESANIAEPSFQWYEEIEQDEDEWIAESRAIRTAFERERTEEHEHPII